MKRALFSKKMEPSCAYCENGKTTADGLKVLCRRKGVCAPSDRCARFVYAPLKRVPHRAAALPTFSKEDFTL